MDDLSVALSAARAGADVVRRALEDLPATEFKAPDNPVTETDRAAEAAILSILREHRPHDGITAEEGGAGAASSQRNWLVDPLDGTVNFTRGIPQVAVSIALYEGGNPAVAVIIDVHRDEEFTAAAGSGASLDGSPLSVSSRRFEQAVVATGFPYDHKRHGASYAAVVGTVLERVQGIRRLGSAALDLAWVAAGRYDGYWEFSLAPWDLAAGILLVREAGGIATTMSGDPASPFHPHAVATNGVFHDDLRRLVAANTPPHLRGET